MKSLNLTKPYILLILLLANGIFAQTIDTQAQDTLLVIAEIRFEFEGSRETREDVLLSQLPIHPGTEYVDRALLDEDIQITQSILELSGYYDSITINVEEGPTGLTVTIILDEGMRIVPVPYPLPDTSIGNNGWSFGLKLGYGNVAGTMSNLNVSGNADIAFGDEKKLVNWSTELEWEQLRIGQLLVSSSLGQYYETWRFTDPTAEAAQQLKEYFSDMKTEITLAARLPIDDLWYAILTQQLTLTYGYEYYDQYNGQSSMYNSEVEEMPFSYRLENEWGREDLWMENGFRRGSLLRIQPAFILNYYDNGLYAPDVQLTLLYSVYGSNADGSKRLEQGYSMRLGATGYIRGTSSTMGEYLRGVEDSSMAGSSMVFLQSSLQASLFTLWGIDFAAWPFFDAGIALYQAELNLRMGFGLEGTASLGSTVLRGRLGYDPTAGELELSFTTGLEF